MEKEIKISVVVVAYNHAEYIEKVIKGILMQKVNVPYEIIIHDDASTDGTDLIIKKYAEEYPNLITAILQKENQYSKGVNVRRQFVHPLVRGKYYAWTEGDDYWIYDGKLQAQYDFMESHPECSLCYHNAINYEPERDLEYLLVRGLPSDFLTDEQIVVCTNGNYPTTSVFAKSKDVLNMPDEFWKAPIGDHPLRLYLATLGQIYYMNRVWAIRVFNHSSSWTHDMGENEDRYRNYCVKYMDFLGFYNQYTENIYLPYIRYICNKNFIRRFLLQADDRPNRDEWCQIAESYYNLLSERAKEINTLEELVEEGLRPCADYDSYILDDVLKPYLAGGKKIYIYGAGYEAGCKAFILMKNYIRFEGFLVTELQEEGMEKMGRSVYELSEVDLDEDSVVWLGLNRRNKDEVIPILKEQGINFITQ